MDSDFLIKEWDCQFFFSLLWDLNLIRTELLSSLVVVKECDRSKKSQTNTDQMYKKEHFVPCWSSLYLLIFTHLSFSVSDQRYEGAFGLLVRRREEHGHAGGAAGPRHPHLNQLAFSPQRETSLLHTYVCFCIVSLSIRCSFFCYRHRLLPTCKSHCGILQINNRL